MAGVVTITGTVNPPAVLGVPVGGVGVTFKNMGATAFDARQATAKGINLYDETNQFIAALGAQLGQPGFVIIDQLLNVLHTLRRTPEMGERVYAP